jgi:UDP-N-acetylmuramate dehydrogenase
MRITCPVEGRRISTIRMGGPLKQLLETDQPDELAEALQTFHRSGEPLVILGSGSNVILPEGAQALSVLRFTGRGITDLDDETIWVESGCSIARLMGWCVQNKRGGLEFLIGIPGTIGGALAVNAGAFGQAIGPKLVSADLFDTAGQPQCWSPETFGFTYRSSRIKHRSEVIVRARLLSPLTDRVETVRRMREFIDYRRAHHPVTAPSAGCFFKNPKPGKEGISAGQVIDQCGLKGFSIGDLMVSPQHANFVINRGRASQGQLDEFCRQIQDLVRSRTGMSLEREVICIGPDGKKY